MQCERCGVLMALGVETAHNGRFLCRECYMDVLAPSGVCSPGTGSWVGSGALLSAVQRRILDRLASGDGASLGELAGGLAMEPAELEREIGRLGSMEKVRSTLKDGKKIFRLR
ncbi:MAG: helix-turn-helix domain-containing protein [Desulfobulbaceae bacterium]|nr:helix-turn-helix domain-containing protein [Desulfobulbaceae bacterium]